MARRSGALPVRQASISMWRSAARAARPSQRCAAPAIHGTAWARTSGENSQVRWLAPRPGGWGCAAEEAACRASMHVSLAAACPEGEDRRVTRRDGPAQSAGGPAVLPTAVWFVTGVAAAAPGLLLFPFRREPPASVGRHGARRRRRRRWGQRRGLRNGCVRFGSARRERGLRAAVTGRSDRPGGRRTGVTCGVGHVRRGGRSSRRVRGCADTARQEARCCVVSRGGGWRSPVASASPGRPPSALRQCRQLSTANPLTPSWGAR